MNNKGNDKENKPYFEIQEGVTDWTWKFFDEDGEIAAESHFNHHILRTCKNEIDFIKKHVPDAEVKIKNRDDGTS